MGNASNELQLVAFGQVRLVAAARPASGSNWKTRNRINLKDCPVRVNPDWWSNRSWCIRTEFGGNWMDNWFRFLFLIIMILSGSSNEDGVQFLELCFNPTPARRYSIPLLLPSMYQKFSERWLILSKTIFLSLIIDLDITKFWVSNIVKFIVLLASKQLISLHG